MARGRLIRIVAVAAAVVVVAVVAAVAVIAGRSTARPAAQAPVAAPITAPPSPSVTPSPTVSTISLLSPSSATIATSTHRLAVARVPGGAAKWHLSKRTDLGAVRTLLVTAQRSDGWLQVQLPVRPNDTRGWVRATDVSISTTPMRIVVNRHTKTLTLLRAGVPIEHFSVAVGAAATPTPAGLFFVSDRLPTLDAPGPFGPFALGLSGYSNVLTSFDGGDGVLGIHGTNADWSVGHAVSHGCVRMHNSDITKLYQQVGLGTPVVVA